MDGEMAGDVLAIFGGTAIRAGGPIERVIDRPEILKALHRAYRCGDWHRYRGPNGKALCEALSALHVVSHVMLCCSGTAGLEIALKGVNVRTGDEVLVSGYDFKGVVSSVLALGAIPVVVDVELKTLAPTIDAFSAAAAPRTKALVVSHLHGAAARMSEIMQFARGRNIQVVEDACQCPGAMIEGKRAGTWGDVGVLSFGGSKLLTAGRGGAVFTNDARIAQRMHLHNERGNQAFPMSELQAAVLPPQLQWLDDDHRKRLASVRWLIERIEPNWGISPTKSTADDVSPGFYKLGLRLSGLRWKSVDRQTAAAAFRAEGIAIDEGFQSVDELFAQSRYRAIGSLNNSSTLSKTMLVLHHPVLLNGAEELQLIVDALRKVSAAAERGDLAAERSS